MISGVSCSVVTPLLMPCNLSQDKRSFCRTSWQLCRTAMVRDHLQPLPVQQRRTGSLARKGCLDGACLAALSASALDAVHSMNCRDMVIQLYQLAAIMSAPSGYIKEHTEGISSHPVFSARYTEGFINMQKFHFTCQPSEGVSQWVPATQALLTLTPKAYSRQQHLDGRAVEW